MLREALDRTLLLMRTRLVESVSDEALLDALTSTTVVLIADERNLQSHAAQSAFISAAMLMARSGHSVHLVAPNVPLFGAQPPLARDRLIEGLLEVGTDMLPDVEFRIGEPDKADLAIALGDSAWNGQADLTLHINATRWAGELSAHSAHPWKERDWPFGALAAAAITASEAFKVSMRQLRKFAGSRVYDKYFAPALVANLVLAPEDTLTALDVGAIDCVSGGAITNTTLFALARIPDVRGHVRVIEPECGDLSNLNRYPLMRRSRCRMRKIDDLGSQLLAGLKVDGVSLRYDEETCAVFDPLAPSVLVGVDHIPSRWLVQEAKPVWLAVGATEDFFASVSFHAPKLACAGCAHPEYSEVGGPIPTVAFVSFIGGLMLAALLAEHIAQQNLPLDQQRRIATTLRLDQPVTWEPLKVNERCPLHNRADREKMVA